MSNEVSGFEYVKRLAKWIKSAERFLYSPPERPDLECYGTGYDGWGVQTNQKAFAVFATLAGHSNSDLKKLGLSRDCLLERSLKLFRFSMESHLTGSFQCSDGKKWGNTWISALGVERMAHGIEAIEESLTQNDKKLFENVIISEAEWLLNNYDVLASPFVMTGVPYYIPAPGAQPLPLAQQYQNGGANRPESNLWNGALLHRAAMLYPDAPNAEKYKEKGVKFLVNSISVPSDGTSEDIVDGKMVKDRFVGANFFENYALNHHKYLNIGYMVICLSNIAMVHFSYKRRGLKPPEALRRRAWDLWRLVKTYTFPDGRILRGGGDHRVRYCYCQDYVIPVWLFINDCYGDSDCLDFERGWLRTVLTEARLNKDGSFLRGRLSGLESASPLYYTRLEADRAVAFSMAARWKHAPYNVRAAGKTARAAIFEQWHDEYHGACLARSPKRVASWTWSGSLSPLGGVCVPSGRSDMAEWSANLRGMITGLGADNFSVPLSHSERMFAGGFLTYGVSEAHSDAQTGGRHDEVIAVQKSVAAALPDGSTMAVMHYAKTLHRTYFRSLKGLTLMMPNDIFNRKIRVYTTEKEKFKLRGLSPKKELIKTNSQWINIDDCLSVIGLYGSDSVYINRPGERQIGIQCYPLTGGMLYADEICYPCVSGTLSYDGGRTVMDIACVVQASVSAEETARSVGRHCPVRDEGHPDLRAVIIGGTDSRAYLMAANFGEADIEAAVRINPSGELKCLSDTQIKNSFSDGTLRFPLKSNEAVIYSL
jgi:hypothetical protein